MLGGGNPETYKMVTLTKSESGQWYLLLLAGMVMVIALLTSKKAHKVIQTSVSLSSQNETDEIFGTNPLARAIIRGVHFTISAFQSSRRVMPLWCFPWQGSPGKTFVMYSCARP